MKLNKMLEQQAAARHALLDNGYRPLPLADKVAFMKGWPQMEVSHETIDRWPSTLKREDSSVPVVTTGVQMTGDLIGVDVDVLDGEVVERLFMLASEVLGSQWTDEVMIRVGKPPKELWLFRTDAPYGMWKSPRYIDEDGQDHMIEVYGGDSVRYFGAVGPHSMKRDTTTGKLRVKGGEYEVLQWYEWEGELSPETTPVSELPVVPVADLERFLTKANDLLAEVPGWELAPKQKAAGSGSGATEYVLTRDMVFDTPEGHMSYADAAAYAAMDRTASCSASWLDGWPHKNKTRCRLHALGEGDDLDLQVFDFDSFTTYLPLEYGPRSPEEREAQVDRVGSALAALDLGAGVEAELEDASYDHEEYDLFEKAVEDIVKRHARNRQTGHYHEMRRGVIDKGIPPKVLSETYAFAALNYERPNRANPNGPPIQRQINPVKVARDTWIANEGVTFDRVGFNPATDARTFVEEGVDTLNAWFGMPELEEAEDDLIELVEQFLEHLIPHDEERAFFLDWLAIKYREPWQRMCAILFVAPNVGGTGRGTLYEMCHQLFGAYSTTVTEEGLFGTFNGWIDRNVLATVNEVGASTRYADKKRDYQRLKELVDPTNTYVSVRHMQQAAVRVRAYHSMMVATNNLNGIMLDDEDRRFAVLRNGEMLDRVRGWADRFMALRRTDLPRLTAALAAILHEREVTRSMRELQTPPKFDAWHEVLAAGDSELDEAIQNVVRKFPGRRAWTVQRLREEVRLELHGSREARPKDGVAGALTDLKGDRAERFGLWNLGQLKHTDRDTRGSIFSSDPEWYLELDLKNRGAVLDKAPDDYRKYLVSKADGSGKQAGLEKEA